MQPTLMRGGTVHMLKGFDPEAVIKNIELEKINFTMFVTTMISGIDYVITYSRRAAAVSRARSA